MPVDKQENMFGFLFFLSFDAFLMSVSLFYGLCLAKGFGKRSDKYAKNMNTKQTITGKQDNSLETSRCQEKDFTLRRGRRWGRGSASSSSFAAAKTVKCFVFPLLPALNERHLIEFDGFTLIRAAAVLSLSLFHLPYLMPQVLVQDFYCLLYYCISRGICFKYALSPCPFAFPLFLLLLLLLFVLQISSPIFMHGVYYALLFRASF